MSQYKEKFVALLEELFQLNQPELDFGLYRILHARSRQIKAFIQNELSAEIDKVFAGQYQTSVQDQLHAARLKIEQTLGDYALEANGDIKPEFAKIKIGQEYEAIRQQAQQGGGLLADDAQIYDHLYRFFSRYYDKGDFMSRRYFVAENDSRAQPYAIPYDGREVMLHWANKDQYYIKSSEYLANFTVDLAAAQKIAGQGGQAGFDFAAPAESLTVHFRLAAASEGEHNNVKEGQERYFLIHSPEPVKLETNAQSQTELVIQFQYRPDPEKTGQAGTWQQKRLNEAEAAIQAALADLPQAEAHRTALATPAPTDKQPNRTLLGKYLGQYTSRNTMDYFIHKNLGGFLRRELDFYIKNEIMRLDDIENAEAPRVESYLKKLQSLRKIARRIIDFLAQIEDFQKKLWLKKKFVVETNYCITLDRIPEALYPENRHQ
jgi:adenine-specific DNA-methyltransferase